MVRFIDLNWTAMTTTTRLAFWPAALLCAGITLSAPASAQEVTPGLWEISTRMQHADKATQDAMAQMQQQMASMPPAQRKQMEAAMASMGMAVDGKGGMRVKTCVTPEKAANMEVPMHDGDCTNTQLKRSGNSMSFSFQCTDPVLKGEATVTFNDAKSYTMKSVTHMIEKGKTQTTTMEAEGRWLQSDCTGAMNAPQKKKR